MSIILQHVCNCCGLYLGPRGNQALPLQRCSEEAVCMCAVVVEARRHGGGGAERAIRHGARRR